MNNKELHYKRLLREYDLMRSKSHQEMLARQQEIYQKLPQIKSIDDELSDSGIKLVRHMMASPNPDSLAAFHKHSDDLIRTKKMILVENGYEPDYLEQKYHCNACKDTGFIGNQTCSCFKQGLINIAYEQSNLQHILDKENFNSFSLKYYSKKPIGKDGISPYDNMVKIRQICVGLIEKFETSKESLLLTGQTGLGKTFLCNCIAKELLDNGFTVLYFTAPQLFKLFEESRFHREDMQDESKNLLDTLFDVDMLIIDDLGTESISTITISDLFNVINSRYLNQTSTIISTNLTFNQLKERYSERIVSRIIGQYTLLRFFGDDIRKLKKYMPLQ